MPRVGTLVEALTRKSVHSSGNPVSEQTDPTACQLPYRIAPGNLFGFLEQELECVARSRREDVSPQ